MLCADIGNTRTKAALFKGQDLLDFSENLKVEQLRVWLEQKPRCLVSKTGSNSEIEQFFTNAQYLNHKTQMPISLDYNTPESLGPDRIAAAIGAYSMGADCDWLILSMGTCITLDLLENGVFKGGLISPGIRTRYKAMHEFTDALPEAQPNPDVKFPGKSTIESLQVGVNESVVNEISGFVNRISSDNPKIKLIQHGGDILNFGNALKIEIFARPKLVLEGLNYLLHHHNEDQH